MCSNTGCNNEVQPSRVILSRPSSINNRMVVMGAATFRHFHGGGDDINCHRGPPARLHHSHTVLATSASRRHRHWGGTHRIPTISLLYYAVRYIWLYARSIGGWFLGTSQTWCFSLLFEIILKKIKVEIVGWSSTNISWKSLLY